MNCHFCNKEINAMTGLKEILKLKKHLIKCKKYPERKIVIGNDDWNKGRPINLTTCSMKKALRIRAESGQ